MEREETSNTPASPNIQEEDEKFSTPPGSPGGGVRTSPRVDSMPSTTGVNPFVNSTLKLGTFGWIRTIIASLTIAWIRAVLIVLILLPLAWLLTKIAVLGLTKEDLEKPLAKWRRRVIYAGRMVIRVMLFVWGVFWIQVTGKPAAYEEASIVVSNHITWFDVLYFAYAECPRYVSRKENMSMPLVRDMLLAFKAILIDRTSHDSKKSAVQAIIDHAQQAQLYAEQKKAKRRVEGKPYKPTNNCDKTQPKHPRLIIFPAGTCANQRALISFKQGAFIPGVPVQPVALSYPFIHFDPCWVHGVSVGFAIWRSFCQFQNYMTVEWLPVYHPTEDEKHDPILYANHVRERIARRLNVPVTEHSFDDVRFQFEAMKLSLPPETLTDLDLVHLKNFVHIKEENLSGILQRFSKIDEKHKGKFNYEQFIKALGLPSSEETQDLFEIMDTDEDGTVSWREYVLGLAFYSEQVNDESKAKMAFQLFDRENKGRIDEEGLYQVLRGAYPGLTREGSVKIFEKADKDGNGWIEFGEFWAFLKANPEYYSMILNFQNRYSTQLSARPAATVLPSVDKVKQN